MTSRMSVLLLATAAALVAACSTYSGGDMPTYQPNTALPGAGASDLSRQTYATTAEVLAAVAAAQHIQELPRKALYQLKALAREHGPDGPENCFDKRRVTAPVSNAQFGECAYGDPNGTTQVVLYGDSRAAMWAATLERVAAISGWQVRVFAKNGCPVADLQFLDNERRTPDVDCDTFHRTAVEEIRKMHPQLVVTASNAGHRLADGEMPTPEQWQDGWSSAYRKLSELGTKLATLGAIPTWADNDAQCVAAHIDDVQACSTERQNAVTPYFDAEKAAATAAGAAYLDTVPWVCAEKCQPVIADIVVYYNPFNFTTQYAEYLSGAVAEALRPAMA